MKRGTHIKKVIYSSWFISAIPAILVMLFIPPLASKYKLQVEKVPKSFIYDLYYDLNSDSISEIARFGKGNPYYNILVLNNNYHVYDQWNLKDNVDPGMSSTFFGNYDGDRFSEIYIFTYKNDSLFLNVNEFFEPSGTILDRVFITKIAVVNNKVTSDVRPAGFFDNNGDGKGELYFSIQTGFGLEPRRLYYFDIVSRKLYSSQFTGMICQRPVMVDVDGDKKPEIFGVMGASGNYKVSTPYSDKSTWLMIFNENLRFEFPPVEFPGFTNQLEINAYRNGNFRGYILSHNTGSIDSAVLKPRIMLFSPDGKQILDKPYSDFGFDHRTKMIIFNQLPSDRIYLFDKDLIELNNNLEGINKVKSPFQSNFTVSLADIDFDGTKEFLLISENEKKLAIYNVSLEKLAETELTANMYDINLSLYSSKDHEHKLYLTSSDSGYFLKMTRNKYFYFGFLAYPGIYLILVIIIEILNRINTIKIQQKESLKQRLITLQLQGIKGQLEPHFTFNTLNSIASLIYLEDREAAYDYMRKFTQLLRSMLNDAEKIYRNLGEEIEFVTTYLELEKLRFGEKFNYEIEISEGVTKNEQVPKLVLQTFAENAVKHGIMPSESGGLIKISVLRVNGYLKMTIEDNGIGREQSSGHSDSVGKGLKLTSEFYDILNHINKKPIKYEITDLYSSSNIPAGTRVDVWVPLDEFVLIRN